MIVDIDSETVTTGTSKERATRSAVRCLVPVSLVGIDTVQTPIDERIAVWSDLAEAFDDATLEAMVADEVGLTGLPDALAAILAGGVRGRVLVSPDW